MFEWPRAWMEQKIGQPCSFSTQNTMKRWDLFLMNLGAGANMDRFNDGEQTHSWRTKPPLYLGRDNYSMYWPRQIAPEYQSWETTERSVALFSCLGGGRTSHWGYLLRHGGQQDGELRDLYNDPVIVVKRRTLKQDRPSVWGKARVQNRHCCFQSHRAWN